MTENISVDRLAAIKETQSLKNSNFSDEAKIVARQIQKARNSLLCEKDFSEKQPVAISEKNPLCGIYFYKCEDSTLYFNIESIKENSVKVCMKCIWADGCFSTENYEGTISDNYISIRIKSNDLHPLPKQISIKRISKNHFFKEDIDYVISEGESFLGKISNNTISGIYSGKGFSISIELHKL